MMTDADPEQWPPEDLGEAEVRIDVDAETYERLHEAFLDAVDAGYTDTFDTFAFNQCRTDCYVTVDGEPVDPTVARDREADE